MLAWSWRFPAIKQRLLQLALAERSRARKLDLRFEVGQCGSGLLNIRGFIRREEELVRFDDGLIIVRARAPAIRQFVTLILCSNQEFFELRFIDTAFRAEPASEVRLFLAEHRGALPQLPNVVARSLACLSSAAEALAGAAATVTGAAFSGVAVIAGVAEDAAAFRCVTLTGGGGGAVAAQAATLIAAKKEIDVFIGLTSTCVHKQGLLSTSTFVVIPGD